jgi:ferredoxin
LDPLSAIIETEFRTCEAVGISKEETSPHLKYYWNKTRRKNPLNIFGSATSTFQTFGESSAIEHISGLAKNGIRVAYFEVGGGCFAGHEKTVPGIPYVIHQLSSSPNENVSREMIQLNSSTVQQAVDFCLIAHKISEYSLFPVLHTFNEDLELIKHQLVQKADVSDISQFLGYSNDQIEALTEPQKEIFGEKRRRIPRSSRSKFKITIDSNRQDILRIIETVFDEFYKITGRKYNYIDSTGTEDADFILISTGELYKQLQKHLADLQNRVSMKIGLLNIHFLHPFPGHLVAQILQNKKGSIYLTNSAELEKDFIYKELELCLKKSIENGRFGDRPASEWPYPDFPAYLNHSEYPLLQTFSYSSPDFSSKLISEIQKIIEDRSSTKIQFRSSIKKTDVETGGNSQNETVDIIYFAKDAFPRARNFGEKLNIKLNYQFALSGEPDEDVTRMILGSNFDTKLNLEKPVDCLVITESASSIPQKFLMKLREGGIILFVTNSNSGNEFTTTITSRSKSVIIEKKIHLFALQLSEEEVYNSELTDAALWGAVLKILPTINTQIFDGFIIHNIIDKLFPQPVEQEKAHFGAEKLTEMDHSQFDTPSVAVTQPKIKLQFQDEPGEQSIEIEDRENFRQLLTFFITGRLADQDVDNISELQLVPVYQYLNKELLKIRYDYPVCINEKTSNHLIVSLKDIIDDILHKFPEKDASEIDVQNILFQIEADIKAIIADGQKGKFSQFWVRAKEALISEFNPEDETKLKIEEVFKTVEKKLDVDGELSDCDQIILYKLINSGIKFIGKEKYRKFSNELDRLIYNLSDILETDKLKSEEARKPENLRATVGTAFEEDLNFDEFSHMLEQTSLPDRLPQNQRKRIEEILPILKTWQPFYSIFNEDGTFFEQTKHQFYYYLKEGNVSFVFGELQAKQKSLTEFFKSLKIARLEVANKYQEERHDNYFKNFSISCLPDEDLEFFPHFIIHVPSNNLDELNRNGILEILETGLPIKFIITFDQIFNELTGSTNININTLWESRLTQFLLSSNKVFVLQSSVSNISHLADGLFEGIKFNGPAIFYIYQGQKDLANQSSQYLSAHPAVASRTFPLIKYNPAMGDGLADRFDLRSNPQLERNWVSFSFEYISDGGDPVSLDAPYTLVDFLAGDPNFSDHFLYIPKFRWHENLVPLDQYLSVNGEELQNKIPYIIMVNREGHLFRVIPSLFMVKAAIKWASYWRGLQELGGINNSYVAQLKDKEKPGEDLGKQQDLQKSVSDYIAETEKSKEELTKQIISNILNNLISGNLEGTAKKIDEMISFEPAEGIAEVSKGEKPAVAEPDEKTAEKEFVVIEEPYIDSYLCTSCNDCININSRMFAYNENKQAYIKDASAGTFKELVKSAEKCPARIIHPGKPKDPNEPGLDKLIKRAEPFNR